MGFFSFFRKSGRVELPQLEAPTNHLAFVLLKSPFSFELPALQEVLRNLGGPTIESVPDGESDGGDDGIEVHMVNLEGIGKAIIGLMDFPIPNGEAEASFPYSMSSLGEEAVLEDYQAHVMVTLMSDGTTKSKMEVMTAFTSLLAAICEVTPSIGVYWGNAGATHTASYFKDLARDPDSASQMMLWSGVSRAPEKGGKVSLLSMGMEQFGLPNLYMISPMTDVSEIFGRFFDLLHYLVTRDEAIPDGDTIGGSAEERIQVTYIKSPANDGSVVWRVEF